MRSSNLIRWCMLAYAIVPVWFARFAVRARSKLGLACQRFSWVLAAGSTPPLPPHCPPPSVGGALVRGKIPTEAGDGVVLAYAIVPVWFTRFAVRARSKLGLTCECKTLGGGGGVALNTTLQVLSTLQGLTALQAFSSFLLFFRYIRDIRVNREPEGLRDL